MFFSFKEDSSARVQIPPAASGSKKKSSQPKLRAFWQREKDSYGLAPSHALHQPKILRLTARIFGVSWVEPRSLVADPLAK